MSDIQGLREKLKNLKVLFVDDEVSIRSGMGVLLGKFFDEIILCRDGEEGLAEFMKRQDIDIVITDIIMPRMSGIVMVDKIKKINPEIFTVFISASRDAQNLEAVSDSLYLKKPISFKDIIFVMEKIGEQQELAKLEKSI